MIEIIIVFHRSEEYTEKTLKKALSLQSSMDADMGGTEILKPLTAIYREKEKEAYQRQVLRFLFSFVLLLFFVVYLFCFSGNKCTVIHFKCVRYNNVDMKDFFPFLIYK